MTSYRRHRRPGPYDRGTYAITITQAQAAAGSVLHVGRQRLMGWSIASVASDSSENQGAVVAPGVGALIVNIAGLPAGDYSVQWTVGLAGAAAAADQDNFNLRNGPTNILASNNPGAAGDYPQPTVVLTLAAGNSISIHAIGAGTAGVTYTGQLIVTPLAGGAIGNFLDGAQVVGVTSTGADQLDTEWFGDDGVYVGTSIALQVTVGAASGCIYVCDDPAEPQEDEPSQPSLSSPHP